MKQLSWSRYWEYVFEVVFAFFVLLALVYCPFYPALKSRKIGGNNSLTNDHGVLLDEVVLGNLEVQRGGTLADTARNVVM